MILDCRASWGMAFAFAWGLLLTGSGPALGQCEMAELVPSDPQQFATFYQPGAIDGDDLVAYDPNRGGFYVFHRSGTTWVEATYSTAPARSGMPAAISGDYIVLGDSADDDGGSMAGAAYVYRRSGDDWIEAAKLTAGDPAAEDLFGVWVAIDGDYIVVGQNRHLNAGPPGSAYIFHRDDQGTPGDPSDDVWIEQAKLTAGDAPADNNRFGRSVSISGDGVLVGAYFDYSGTNTGAAYVYRRDGNTWTEEVKLTPSNGAAGDTFGFSVSLSGDVAVIGAPWHAAVGSYSGTAYVFRVADGTWEEADQLLAGETVQGDEFGRAVAIDGDHIVVGAPFHGGGPFAPGAAYVFKREGGEWIEAGQLVPTNPDLNLFAGVAVAVAGDYAVVADAYPWDDIPDQSSAYVFAIAGDCNDNTTPDICDILGGQSDDANDNGVPDECEEVVFIVGSYPPDGAIDARQPTEVDGSGDYGWSEVELTFNEDVTGLTPEDFTITLDPPGTPPYLAFVYTEGNVAWLQFGEFVAEPIPPGHWTIITHNDSGSSIRIGYLPADVSGDRTSAPLDILALIDFLNEVGDALEIWQSDTDRSGEANPADILRVIDLLNGAGEFEVWNGQSLP